MQQNLGQIKIHEQLRRFGLRKFVNYHQHFLYESTVNTVQLAVAIRVDNGQVERIAHTPDAFTCNLTLYNYVVATQAENCEAFLAALHRTDNGHIVRHIAKEFEPIQWENSPAVGQADSNDEQDFQAQLQNFETLGQLGLGAFGIVWAIQHKTTKMKSALKAIKLDDDYKLEDAEKEVKTVQEIFKRGEDVRLRYVINIWDFFHVPREQINDVRRWISKFWLSDYPPPHGFCFIHTELCTDNTLDRWLKNPETNNNLEEGRRLFSHIAQGLACLHDNNCIHRDLSPVNILLTRVTAQGKRGTEIVAKISDLGKSRIRSLNNISTMTIKSGGEFNSPEMSNSENYTFKTDIYSLGLILFCILRSIKAIEGTAAAEYYANFQQLKQKLPKIPKDFVEKFPNEAELLGRMLAFDPNLRPSAQESLDTLENRMERRIDNKNQPTNTIKIHEQLRRFGLREFVNHHSYHLYESTLNTLKLSIALRMDHDEAKIINLNPSNFARNMELYNFAVKAYSDKCEARVAALAKTQNEHIVTFLREELEKVAWDDSSPNEQTDSDSDPSVGGEIGQEFQKQLQNYESLGQLGQGSFGVVWKIQHKTTKMMSALKAIKLDDNYKLGKAAKETENAQEIFKYKVDARLRYVINIWDFFYVPFKDEIVEKKWIPEFWLSAYPTPHGFYFIHMELCTDFTLERWLKNPSTNVNQEEGRRLFSHIAQGLACLHDNNCIHRDLSPVNILLTRVAAQGKSGTEIVAKISDFGKSRIRLPDSTSTMTIKAWGEFNSPEISASKHYSFKTDIYSLGLILFCILSPIKEITGPAADEYYASFLQLKQPIPKFPEDFLENFLKEAELLRRMLALDPELRPSAANCLHSLQNRKKKTDDAHKIVTTSPPKLKHGASLSNLALSLVSTAEVKTSGPAKDTLANSTRGKLGNLVVHRSKSFNHHTPRVPVTSITNYRSSSSNNAQIINSNGNNTSASKNGVSGNEGSFLSVSKRRQFFENPATSFPSSRETFIQKSKEAQLKKVAEQLKQNERSSNNQVQKNFSDKASTPTIKITAEMGVCARALYDWHAAEDGEISFNPGELVTNIEMIDKGWWEGLSPQGIYGLFPSNYVQLLNRN